MIEVDIDAQPNVNLDGYGAGKKLYDNDNDMDWLATYRLNKPGEWDVWSPQDNATVFSEAEANEEMYRQAAVRLLTR